MSIFSVLYTIILFTKEQMTTFWHWCQILKAQPGNEWIQQLKAREKKCRGHANYFLLFDQMVDSRADYIVHLDRHRPYWSKVELPASMEKNKGLQMWKWLKHPSNSSSNVTEIEAVELQATLVMYKIIILLLHNLYMISSIPSLVHFQTQVFLHVRYHSGKFWSLILLTCLLRRIIIGQYNPYLFSQYHLKLLIKKFLWCPNWILHNTSHG